MTKNHPYPGPNYDNFAAGTIAITSSAAVGPNVPCNFCWLTLNTGSVTVTITQASGAAGQGVPVPKDSSIYLPCQNLANLYFVGSGNATLGYLAAS